MVSDRSEEFVLETRGLTKSFPGVKALNNVNFILRKGEVHAIVGENGAGKSTLMHIIGGIFAQDKGDIFLDGVPVQIKTPHAAANLGISVVFQELSLVENLSIAENIFANRQPIKKANMINWKKLYADTCELLQLFELDFDPGILVKNLSAAHRQVVEILKALSHKPRVFILDEPTSSLTSVETELLFLNIKKLVREGMSCIYISHHLPEIFEISDRVTVLRDGLLINTSNVTDVTEDNLITMMVGRTLGDMFGIRTTEPGEEYVNIENAGCGKDFQDVSFTVRRGEIVGFAGLVGAGRTKLGRGLFGLEPINQGRFIIEGNPVEIRSPVDAIKHGIAYVSEDRKTEGLFLRMTVRENFVAPKLHNFAGAFGFMRDATITSFADKQKEIFTISTPSTNHIVNNLSGGNQQKVLLAMWLSIKPKLLIIDEPTRGVDVGARSDIYHLLRKLADEGTGIIMISSDLTEILGLSDRIMVMREGRIVNELTKEEATEENIIASATGVTDISYA